MKQNTKTNLIIYNLKEPKRKQLINRFLIKNHWNNLLTPF